MANRIQDLTEKTKSFLIKTALRTTRSTGTAIQSLDAYVALDWVNQRLQKRGAGFYGKLITIILCTYFLSDLSAILLGKFIPDTYVPQGARSTFIPRRPHTLEENNVIFARNLFNSKGLIPGEEAPPGDLQDPGGPPVKTSLPFNLIGTLILKDELRSIATIEDKSASTVYPVRVKDEIPSKAKILRIEARRVIFINTASNRREYVDLPEDVESTAPRITLGGAKTAGGPAIEKVSTSQFNVSRSEVDRTLADLNNVLTQARAVPNFENGAPAGYKLFQIVPGSIYDKLGLQNGDVISGLNGQPINDPGKAFEMLNALKDSNTSHLDLQVKRDGRSSTFSYEIR